MSFATETTIKAVRKNHRCDGCGGTIEVGSSAIKWAGTTGGDFATATYHTECRSAEIALNEIMGFQYGDEWWSLCEIDSDDHAWLLETFPAVAERMGIRVPADGLGRDPRPPQTASQAPGIAPNPTPSQAPGRS